MEKQNTFFRKFLSRDEKKSEECFKIVFNFKNWKKNLSFFDLFKFSIQKTFPLIVIPNVHKLQDNVNIREHTWNNFCLLKSAEIIYIKIKSTFFSFEEIDIEGDLKKIFLFKMKNVTIWHVAVFEMSQFDLSRWSKCHNMTCCGGWAV